jgi:hypothetical protein
MKSFFRRAVDVGVMLIALPLLASMLLLPPMALISETIDLARMRERSTRQRVTLREVQPKTRCAIPCREASLFPS